MRVGALQYFFSGISIILFVYLLYCGRKGGFLRHFPIVYAYLSWMLLRGILGWVLIYYWGYSSSGYYYYYFISDLLTPLLQALVLISIYYKIKFSQDKGHWLVLAAVGSMMAWYLFSRTGTNPFLVYSTINLYFQVLFCLLIHVQLYRNRAIVLGRNYESILYGLSLMIMLQAMTHVFQLFQYIPGQYFPLFFQLISMVPWMLYALGMRKLDLPRQLEPEVVHEIEASEAVMRRAVRSLR